MTNAGALYSLLTSEIKRDRNEKKALINCLQHAIFKYPCNQQYSFQNTVKNVKNI